MRRRLLVSTLAIAMVCVVVLGVPLAILARHQVWTSARDRVREQAASVATGLEDRLDAHQAIDLQRYLALMPHRRITVAPTGRPSVTAGIAVGRSPITGTVLAADTRITVQEPQGPTVTRARLASVIVIGLALLAAAAAVALALWQSRRLARPIAELVTRADALGDGQFSAEPAASGVPEIDQISHVLERSARQIGTLVDLQRNFASDAAHQLRTPLTSIGLHLDEIAQIGDDAVTTEAAEALDQVTRLDSVITGLLARARGDSADPTLVDLRALIDEGAAPWERVLARQDRQLLRDVPPRVCVLARREHLLGVLTSLLDNAVAHGSGDVRLTVMRVRGSAVLRVCDEGPGVPPELVPAVFERRVSGGSGTGIGLALARSLAAAESGALELSAANRAEFVLTLPAVDPRGSADVASS